MLLRKKIPLGYVYSLIKYRLFIVMFIAGTISFFDQYFKDWGISFGESGIIPVWLPGLLGTLIALVLAFRTNQSYDRWWEARKLWGAIVNDSRSLVREVNYLNNRNVKPEKHRLFVLEMSDLTVLWLHILKDSLRNLNLNKHDFMLMKLGIRNQSNLCHAILDKMQELVQDAYDEGIINDFHQTKVTQTINNLGVSMGGCERIKNTVFPQLYASTIDFAIWLFVVIFPIAFRDPNEYVEFPIVVLVSMVFMMLEKVGIQIQDPFQNRPTDVPMDTIVYGLEKLVRENEDSELPTPLKDYEFYEL